ncbi:hypothetical protein L5515_019241 [Caenorhabditis briggsae]|uniref:Uncharacterized protein n=1 Tax=Caenorhabditis briggsae TaxID=6238 RepID=A0AAE9JSX6_CAEBR|nr:hypothetical protein L5515_019241 [Caenorhabditis briggsae]
MDVLDRMTAEEYHANFPRTCNKTVRIQASPNSAFQTTPYGLRLFAEEAVKDKEVEKKEDKNEEAKKAQNPLLTKMGRFSWSSDRRRKKMRRTSRKRRRPKKRERKRIRKEMSGHGFPHHPAYEYRAAHQHSVFLHAPVPPPGMPQHSLHGTDDA